MCYQDAFFTPGISWFVAISRKQMRQRPKSRMKARFLPQRKQRRTMRDENFGFFLPRAMTDSFAMLFFLFPLERDAQFCELLECLVAVL